MGSVSFVFSTFYNFLCTIRVNSYNILVLPKQGFLTRVYVERTKHYKAVGSIPPVRTRGDLL